jgi:dihydropteroate synthase
MTVMTSAALPELAMKPLIMGIVNVTPDSFSGDGVLATQAAIAQGLQMIKDGADILDIGGESTRPDAVPISADEEAARVLPVIDGLRRQTLIPISIDTMKSSVASAALENGASWINDVTGGQGDTLMLSVAAATGAPIVLMHNRASWRKAAGGAQARAYEAPVYRDFMNEVHGELKALRDAALAAGVAQGNIMLDPGIGFGKSVAQNCQLIAGLKRFADLDAPLLVGPSRKSFIGMVLDASPAERVEGTAAAVALSVANGAHILRVHDVKAMRRVADMAWALLIS